MRILNWALCFPCYWAACLVLTFPPFHFFSDLLLDLFCHCEVGGGVVWVLSCLGVTCNTYIHPSIRYQLSWEVCHLLLILRGHSLEVKNCFNPRENAQQTFSILCSFESCTSLLIIKWDNCCMLSICHCASPLYFGERCTVLITFCYWFCSYS